MNQQRHIINKQILEVHLQDEATVKATQTEILQLYHEKLVPIINELCDQHSAVGTQCKIEKLTLDLGNVNLQEFEGVFAQKFAEAIASEEVTTIADTREGTPAVTGAKTPLDALGYYLMTGTLPWWAPSSNKSYLQELLDELNDTPSPAFKALIRQIGQQQAYLDRFVNTFSEAQIAKTLTLFSASALGPLPKIKEEITEVVRRNQAHFPNGLTPQKVTKVFWSAVFAHVTLGTDQSGLVRYAIHQTLRTLGIEVAFFAKDIEKNHSDSYILKVLGSKYNGKVAQHNGIYQQAKKMGQTHPNNPLLQAFIGQLSRVIRHPLFARIDASQLQVLSNLLTKLEEAQRKAGIADAKTLKVVTEANLGPLSSHLQLLNARLKQMLPSTGPNILEKLRSTYNETDFISVQNAGLVILWPFLKRFFENLDLLSQKAFKTDSSKYKAAVMLQHLIGEEADEVFEGQLTLNKVLCGINLDDPIPNEPVSEEEKDIAEGLLSAVVARGPLWKNLSTAGFRRSYLRREGLLRSRDGHWLLQVKRETHDITLEKLPWGFGTVKLPWMNEILIVEWT